MGLWNNKEGGPMASHGPLMLQQCSLVAIHGAGHSNAINVVIPCQKRIIMLASIKHRWNRDMDEGWKIVRFYPMIWEIYPYDNSIGGFVMFVAKLDEKSHVSSRFTMIFPNSWGRHWSQRIFAMCSGVCTSTCHSTRSCRQKLTYAKTLLPIQSVQWAQS